MPNSISAAKSLRQSLARRARNRQQRSKLRTEVKRFRTLMEQSPSREDADKALSSIAKTIDQAAAKRLIHQNTASRTKSRLASLKKSVCS